MGALLVQRIEGMLVNKRVFESVRGKGLMIGIELDAPCGEMTAKALEKGLLINVTSDQVIRLLPPLTITDDEASQIVDIICSLIENT
jgi:acetylornithine aminotransferase